MIYSGLVAAVLTIVVLPANGMGEISDNALPEDPAWPVSQAQAGAFAASQQGGLAPFDAFISEALQNNRKFRLRYGKVKPPTGGYRLRKPSMTPSSKRVCSTRLLRPHLLIARTWP